MQCCGTQSATGKPSTDLNLGFQMPLCDFLVLLSVRHLRIYLQSLTGNCTLLIVCENQGATDRVQQDRLKWSGAFLTSVMGWVGRNAELFLSGENGWSFPHFPNLPWHPAHGSAGQTDTGMPAWDEGASLCRVWGYRLCSVLEFHNFCNVFVLTRWLEMSSLALVWRNTQNPPASCWVFHERRSLAGKCLQVGDKWLIRTPRVLLACAGDWGMIYCLRQGIGRLRICSAVSHELVKLQAIPYLVSAARL